MKRFKFNGTITIEHTYHIADEVIEVEDDEDKEDAITALIEDLDPSQAYDSDTNTYALDVEELDEDGEDLAARRKREREALLAWNAGLPIPA